MLQREAVCSGQAAEGRALKDLTPHRPALPRRPLRQRLADAAVAIRVGITALARSRGTGPLRMMPIYDRTERRWIEGDRLHVAYEDDWIGLAYYRDGQLVHEIRWDSGWPRLIPHQPTDRSTP